LRAIAVSEYFAVVSKSLTDAGVRSSGGADSVLCGGRPGEWRIPGIRSLLLSA